VRRAVEGADAVFHVAAKVGLEGTRAEFWAANVTGTEILLDACQALGVSRLVFTSTPSVVIGHEDIEGGDESLPYPERFAAFYPETKAEAERRVRAASGETLQTVSLRPHLVYGPGDTSLHPRILARAKRLRRIGQGGKRTDVTFIDDAVQAHLLAEAALRARPEVVGGQAYFVTGGEPIEIWTLVDRLLEAGGKPRLRKTISKRAALAAARVAETVHRWTGARGEPVLSTWVVHELTSSHWFDISAARRDLGYIPRVGLDEGLARVEAALREGRD
jgi:nucleoside-diphosphate-sugar epimerase